MAKALSQRIADRARTKVASTKGKNRASFLAVRYEVKQSLEDGWSVKEIWETLFAEGKVSFGYDAFIGYVDRLIRHPLKLDPPPIFSLGQPSATAAKAGVQLPLAGVQLTTEPPAAKSVNPGGFSFNPTPDKENLM